MSTNSILKREGITVIEQLNTLKVNTIAISIANKLCSAFPEHNLNSGSLFTSFSRMNMYIASMPDDHSSAKYFYKNNSIYFNEYTDFKDIPNIAMHECIHFLQEVKDANGNLTHMGLYNMSSGAGINEAAVQLMASEATGMLPSKELYYNIAINTTSPNYYPLECTLLKEIAYFTGTYPLYHSTINSNDIFKNTFTAKSDAKTYAVVVKNFDKLLQLEDNLNYFMSEMKYEQKPSSIKLLNRLADFKKKEIVSLFFETQNLIMKRFFASEFNNIRTLEDLKAFKQRCYDFKDVIGATDGYEFYTNFYVHMMEALEGKKEQIENFGEINLYETANTSLVLVDNTRTVISFVNVFFRKIKKLLGRDSVLQNINQW
ncbi:MAG: hypothetical protein FWC53_02535 [Firmicutes bacterium]|nr:hypothetical protein [Bacillota bacterium]